MPRRDPVLIGIYLVAIAIAIAITLIAIVEAAT